MLEVLRLLACSLSRIEELALKRYLLRTEILQLNAQNPPTTPKPAQTTSTFNPIGARTSSGYTTRFGLKVEGHRDKLGCGLAELRNLRLFCPSLALELESKQMPRGSRHAKRCVRGVESS